MPELDSDLRRPDKEEHSVVGSNHSRGSVRNERDGTSSTAILNRKGQKLRYESEENKNGCGGQVSSRP